MVTIREHLDHSAAPTITSREPRSTNNLADVVTEAASGHPAAWEELTRRFGTMIKAVARSCRLNDADVAEVHQVTWLRLVENIERIEQPERLGAWLATTAKRESLRVVRTRDRITFDNELLERQPDDGASPDAGPIAQERAQAMLRAFVMLPPRCQRLLRLLASDDPPSYKEITTMLAMPIGSIGPTRGRCLEHLRRIMEDIGADA